MLRFTVAVLFLAAVGYATEFYDCDVGNPVDDVRVVGCDSLPCEFIRGDDIVADVDFTLDSEATKLEPWVRVNVLGMWMNYTIGYDDACPHLTSGKCPVEPGLQCTYNLRIPVLKNYPKVSLDVEVTLNNQNGNPLVCFGISGKVVD